MTSADRRAKTEELLALIDEVTTGHEHQHSSEGGMPVFETRVSTADRDIPSVMERARMITRETHVYCDWGEIEISGVEYRGYIHFSGDTWAAWTAGHEFGFHDETVLHLDESNAAVHCSQVRYQRSQRTPADISTDGGRHDRRS